MKIFGKKKKELPKPRILALFKNFRLIESFRTGNSELILEIKDRNTMEEPFYKYYASDFNYENINELQYMKLLREIYLNDK